MLQLPQSTATEVVNTDLGLKPIQMILDERRVKYYQKIKQANYKGSDLVTLCVEIQENNPAKHYFIKEIQSIVVKTATDQGDSFLAKINSYYKRMIMNSVRTKQSLAALPSPKIWWKKQNYVNESSLSGIIAKFRSGNAGLGNRDSTMSCFGISNNLGQVKVCQLCHNGNNNEVHVMTECTELIDVRTRRGWNGRTVLQMLNMSQGSSVQKMRKLLKSPKSNNHKLGSFLQEIRSIYIHRWLSAYEERTEL